MSAVEFHNSGGYSRWANFPRDVRDDAERKTTLKIAQLLHEGGSFREFPDFPVVIAKDAQPWLYPEEISWNTCDVALDYARRASGTNSAPLLELWATVGLAAAEAEFKANERRWLLGDAPMPTPREPDRYGVAMADRPILHALDAPLLVAPDPARPGRYVLRHPLVSAEA